MSAPNGFIRIDILAGRGGLPRVERFNDIWEALARARELKGRPGTKVQIVVEGRKCAPSKA